MFKVPELLAPAGSLDKLKVAIDYGANAVYLGALKFGLRSAAQNFTQQELVEGVEYAHARGALVYIVLNGFLHDKDINDLREYLTFLDASGVDAAIISDLGVIQTVRKYSSIPVHLSTQASCLNVESAKLWKKFGVERIVVGREVSIAESQIIKEQAGIEIEMFVHGSMCMAYSGNCVISNYTQGRDSNRGGCAHSCRFEYSIDFDGDLESRKAYFMSSKDLNGLRVLEDFIKAGIDSIKVEGRMKSHLYVGTISKVYSEALNFYKEHGHFLSDDLLKWENELKKVTHRTYEEANLVMPAGKETIFNEREIDSNNDYVIIGNILEVQNEHMIIEVKNAWNKNDELEILPFKGDAIILKTDKIQSLDGELIERTNPSSLVTLPMVLGAKANNIVRMRL